tara:strand:- start:2383 stop:2856 length:474 start_codon:yes stop_codon:yes gene_type:complete
MHIGTNSIKLDITTEIDTKKLAEKLSNFLKKGDVVFLFGEMGTGKTTFVKYLINSMQMKNNEDILEVQSPTFNILNEYEVNGLKILHYDLYRLKDKKELENVGQIKNQTDKLILIEWPELIEDNVSSTISINFAYEDDLYKRSLSISSSNKNLVNGF